jgi:hypothetical protein
VIDMHTQALRTIIAAPATTARLRLGCLVVGLLLLGACSTVVKVTPDDAPLVPLIQAERGYAAVLQRHVNDSGEVDFSALQADQSGSGIRALKSYVQAVAMTPLDAAPTPDAQLAHMINAYNALSMFNVIASGIPDTHAGWAKVRFFILRKFEIGGRTMSLYTFENEVIRKLGEPRIHFALNCSAVSCPVLPRVPFTAGGLQAELERETRAFFARPQNLRIAHAERTVYFNEILKFYTEDVVPAQAPGLIAYAQRYTETAIPPDYAIAFTPYDWTVANSQRPRAK